MELHTREWGGGDEVAVLVHGMLGESRQFWEVGPALADRGYRVVAVDLPGHGLSPRLPDGGLDDWAEALAGSVTRAPALALGHSLGAMVLSAALPLLRPHRAVYIDVPFEAEDEEPDTAAALASLFEESRRTRSLEGLAATRPWWKQRDREVEVEAARLFDVPTLVALCLDADTRPVVPPPTTVPSLLVHAEPSDYVPARRVAELAALGFDVRGVAGAGHCVWYGFFEQFMTVLDDWLAAAAPCRARTPRPLG